MTEQQFVKLLNENSAYLKRAALAITGNETDASDALQEASLKAYIARDQLRGGADSFRPWVKRILLNTCLQIIKQRSKVVPLGGREEILVDTSPDTPSSQEHDVWEAVAGLPEQLREAVALRYIFDLSQEQVADKQRVPVGTVKSRLNRALSIMREGLMQQKEVIAHEAGVK